MGTRTRVIAATAGFAVIMIAYLAVQFTGTPNASARRPGDPQPTATLEHPAIVVSGGEEEIADATSYAPGISAIQPDSQAVPGMPAISGDSVRAFLLSTPPSYWDRTSPPPIIESIEFVTAQEVSERLADSLLRPPETMLCVVTLRGRFLVDAPPAAGPDGRGVEMVGQTSILVFDAQTGNWLMESVQ